MPKKVFISYANERMSASLKQIGKQARRTGLFDEVFLWTPDKLPEYILQSPLMKYTRGGGYWCWKPVIIYETLQQFEEGTIVVFADAGCRVRKAPEWKMYFELMKRYDTILFQYPAEMPEWKQWKQTSSKIKYWVKKSCMEFLDTYIGKDDWHDEQECLGSFMMMKSRENTLVEQWRDLILNHPDIVVDPTESEYKDQIEGFAYHKHEQAIITALSKYVEHCFILPELSETGGRRAAVHTSRIRAKTTIQYYWILAKQLARETIGDELFVKLKHCVGIKSN